MRRSSSAAPTNSWASPCAPRSATSAWRRCASSPARSRRGLKLQRTAPIETIRESLPPELLVGGEGEQFDQIIAKYRESLYPESVAIDVAACERVVTALRAGGALDRRRSISASSSTPTSFRRDGGCGPPAAFVRATDCGEHALSAARRLLRHGSRAGRQAAGGARRRPRHALRRRRAGRRRRQL